MNLFKFEPIIVDDPYLVLAIISDIFSEVSIKSDGNISKNTFSISQVWNNEIIRNNLNGFESKENFFHVTDLEIYNQLIRS